MIVYWSVCCTTILGVIGWQSFLSASLMLATAGLIAMILLRGVSVRSWRLRSWLLGAVLLQGLMVFRLPIHLGLVEPEAVAPVAISPSDMATVFAGTTDPGQPAMGNRYQGSRALLIDPAETQLGILDGIGRIHWHTALAAVWATVVLAIVTWTLLRYLWMLQRVRHLSLAPHLWRQQWNALVRQSGKAGQSDPCEMLVSRSIGPMMIRRPSRYCLVVPERYWQGLSTEQRRGVMLHELAHIERRDVWRQLIARLIATFHWFNPVAWWALRHYELATELACDQRVARDGTRTAAGFASALVGLVGWYDENRLDAGRPHRYWIRGVGFQAMATPPLTVRVTRLLKPNAPGDSLMKRIVLSSIAAVLIAASLFQIRMTGAQETASEDPLDQLQVIEAEFDQQFKRISSQLDPRDPTTERLGALLNSASGRIAVAGYLDALRGQARDRARSEAIPRFVDHHFTRDSEGKLHLRDQSAAMGQHWKEQSQRLADNIRKIKAATDEIAGRMETSTEAGGLFKRLLSDPQAPVAVLMTEMDGGDLVTRYLSEALDRILVERGDGTFVIVESRRAEAEEQIEKFERADGISRRLRRALPTLASEFADDDDPHRQLIEYLNNPVTASVVAIQMADDVAGPSEAVARLHEHFESASTDTTQGLKITEEEAWGQLEEIFQRVDRAQNMMERVHEKLVETSESLSTDDPLTARMAEQMKREPLAVLLAAEIPYAESDPGQELQDMLSEVLTETDGKLSINSDRAEEVSGKSRELLQICRRIRLYISDIDEMLDQIADRQLVDELGEAGRYAMLGQIRRFAEQYRPDPLVLMREELLVQTDDQKLRVREDRRDIVRRLMEQSERVRAEAGNDDF